MPRGGARPNTGGKRPGAGRKPVRLGPLPACSEGQTPLEFLLATMRDKEADGKVRLEAAKAAAPYLHPRAGESGIKAGRQSAAGVVSKGKYAPAAPPKLVINNT